jgi:hypothetical protein
MGYMTVEIISSPELTHDARTSRIDKQSKSFLSLSGI